MTMSKPATPSNSRQRLVEVKEATMVFQPPEGNGSQSVIQGRFKDFKRSWNSESDVEDKNGGFLYQKKAKMSTCNPESSPLSIEELTEPEDTEEVSEVEVLRRKLHKKKKELDRCKQKLEEKDELLNMKCESIECKDEENDDLRLELQRREVKFVCIKEELEEKGTQLGLLNAKLVQQEQLVQAVSEQIECPVCMEIPRTGPVPVCPNGHFVCLKCLADPCPTCRIAMGGGKSLLAVTVLERVQHCCKFVECNEKFLLVDIEKHEAVCKHRIVPCLLSNCKEKVSLVNLLDHLVSDRCMNMWKDVIPLREGWNSTDWQGSLPATGVDASVGLSWKVVRLHTYSDQACAVFPTKIDGQYYFNVVMLATEKECSKYRFELAVHQVNSDLSDSEFVVRFEGHPHSIDLDKKDINICGANAQLMAKVMIQLGETNWFRLSLKMSKL